MKARLSLAAALLLAGCTAGPDYQPPAVATGTAVAPDLIEAHDPAFDRTPLPAGWWRLYGNPTLDGLIDKALRRNPDVKSALASLEEAQASLRESQRQRTPSTDLSVNPAYSQASADANGLPKEPPPAFIFSASEMLSYDFDVAGRLRRSIEAARAQVGARAAALDQSRVTIAAETANAYSTICATGLRIAVTRQSVATADANLKVTQRYFAAGITGANDVVRARTQKEQTASMLPNLIAQNRAALFMLATLTGDPPEQIPAGVEGCDAPPVLRRPIPVGNGTEMLRRRPDVREAERKLAASVAQIGVSAAQLYPNISLGASIGEVAKGVSDIPRYRAFKWSIGPLISWSFPNSSVARAQVDQSSAAARGALAQFDGTVLTALRQTETALNNYARALDTERQLRAARDDAALALRNSQKLYRGGVGSFLDVLDAQRTLAQANDSLAQATTQVAQDQITLFQSLGGGWQDAPAVEPVDLRRVAPVKP